MLKKRVFISSRIKEMLDFREAAVHAIESAGMEAIHFSTIDPQNFLKSDLEHLAELLDGVKSCVFFWAYMVKNLIPIGRLKAIPNTVWNWSRKPQNQ